MSAQTTDDAGRKARSVFAGLVPSAPGPTESHFSERDRGRLAKSMFNTVPILLVGSMAAMTLNLTAPVEAANAKPAKPKDAASESRKSVRDAAAVVTPASSAPASLAAPATLAAPASYRVAAGDTVSDIAARYGLSTASVLALNGLGWSSMIFPGQQLKLTNGLESIVEVPADATPSGRYTIVSGDTISAIADRFGVSTLSVLTANGLGWASIIYPGQTIAIPGLIGPGTPSPEPADPPVALVAEPTSDEGPIGASPVAETPVATPVVVPAPAPAAPPPPAPANGSYTIQSGDTLSAIAARFGLSTQSLLDANGLDWSSVIFTGHVLVIPGGTVAPASDGSVAYLDGDMQANASIIIQVGRELGVPDYGIVIALATAMQESSMRNISWGDLDSVGLFQQRPSAGWGSVDQLTTPDYAARLFYGGPNNPNAGNTRGLLDIGGWQSMSVTEAAQRVQISAYPDAYAKWESSARAWLAALG